MTQLVSEVLKNVRLVIVIVVQHMVMCWPRSSLDSRVRAEVEIVLAWMADISIDHSTSGNVVRLTDHIISIVAEKSHMVTLLDADEGDSRCISTILLKFKAGFSNGSHLVGEDKFELPLADSISVHDDLLRLLFVLGVEFLEQFLDHILGVGNVLNSSLLYRDCGDELRRNGVHRTNNSCDRWSTKFTSGWMGHIGAENDDGLVHDGRSHL